MPSTALAPASKSASTPSRSRNRCGTASGQPVDQLGGELAQGVVAGAHDDDAVAGCGFAQQRLADRGAVRNVLGLAAGSANGVGQPFGPARLVDGAALVDRVGQVEAVAVAHAA